MAASRTSLAHGEYSANIYEIIEYWFPFCFISVAVWTVTNCFTSFPNNHSYQDMYFFLIKTKLSRKRVNRTFILPVLKQWCRNNFYKNIWLFSEQNLNFKRYKTLWRDGLLSLPLTDWVSRLPNQPTGPIREVIYKAQLYVSYLTRCFTYTIDFILKIIQLGSYFHLEGWENRFINIMSQVTKLGKQQSRGYNQVVWHFDLFRRAVDLSQGVWIQSWLCHLPSVNLVSSNNPTALQFHHEKKCGR